MVNKIESVVFKKISYRDLKEKNPFIEYDDQYGIAQFITKNIKNVFLTSPSVVLDNTAVILAIVNNVIVGRHILYDTKVSLEGQLINAFSSGSTEVHFSQRGKGIGSMINKITLDNMESPIYLFSLVTPAYISILSKKENNCIIFDIPQLIMINNLSYAFQSRGISGKLLILLSSIGNILLWFYKIKSRIRLKELLNTFTIKKMTKVPSWAGEMCNSHNFKYSEYHNTEWLQWNLDNNLSGLKRDIQSFYGIFKGEQPVGFFMTKERVRKDIPKCSNMICGTICEWASIDEKLSESDINILAISTFSKECYHILTVTNNTSTIKNLKKLGFISYGFMQMGFQNKGILHKYPEMRDINQWRIRFACCNSVLY